MIGFERDWEFAWEILTNSKSHWVYDMEHDVLCVVGLGDHIGAVRFIVRKFYGLNRIYREDIPKWQEIIGNNMIFIMQRSMIQNITLVVCLESIKMRIEMNSKIIDKIQKSFRVSL